VFMQGARNEDATGCQLGKSDQCSATGKKKGQVGKEKGVEGSADENSKGGRRGPVNQFRKRWFLHVSATVPEERDSRPDFVSQTNTTRLRADECKT